MKTRFLAVALLCGAAALAPSVALAQAELTGTYIRYAGMGSSGVLINASSHSFQYTESGFSPYSCDAFFPGSPVESFTLTATAGGTTVTATNSQSATAFTTVSGPTVSGRTISWSGRYTSGSTQLSVAQTLEMQSSDRHATLTVRITNAGSTSISNLYYLRNADPDHGSCGIGTDTSTNNDVRRQPPTNGNALVTASGGSPAVVIGIGAHDTRARVTATGFHNTDGPGTWASPVDPAGALDDVATDIVFRETTLPIGASTTFVIYYVFGSSVSMVESRFDALAGATCGSCDDGNPCTVDSCSFGTCVHDAALGASCDDGSYCTTADACSAGGVCVGTVRSCDDGDPCTSDRCDGSLARCVNDRISSGMCAPDSGVEPERDAGVEPERDAGTEPVVDAGVEPDPDGGTIPEVDGGTGSGGGAPIMGRRSRGCSAADGGDAGALGWLLLVGVSLSLRRRRRSGLGR